MHPDLATDWNLEAEALEVMDEPCPPFEAYYDAERKEYLIRNAEGRWLSQNARQFGNRLKNAGIADPAERSRITQYTEDHFDVRYAAPLAGRMAGFYNENGIRLLVTSSPSFIHPVEGAWSTLRAFLEGLLMNSEEDHGATQWSVLNAWLKIAIEALRAGRQQDGQALAIAGERDCGKSLFQHLLTLLLGGRSAKAARYMMGNTDFNSELFECEHIMLEDEFMSHSISDRLRLGTAIKNFTVSTQMQSCHRKGRVAVNLSPW